MTPGTRVRLPRTVAFWPAGSEGTVVEMRQSLLNGHDFAVQWDDDPDGPTCWDTEQVEVIA